MTWHIIWRRLWAWLTLLLLGALATSAVAQTSVPLVALPEVVREFVDDAMAFLQFDASEKANLLQGKILFTGMPSQEKLPQQLTVAGAMLLVHRPMTEVVEAYLNHVTFTYRSDILTYKQLASPPEDQSGHDAEFAEVLFTAAEEEEPKYSCASSRGTPSISASRK